MTINSENGPEVETTYIKTTIDNPKTVFGHFLRYRDFSEISPNNCLSVHFGMTI
jgi:hypothetical protein